MCSSSSKLIIGVDFDGTIVEHAYPEIGAPVPGAINVLKKLARSGHRIIVWTMRSGGSLVDAMDYMDDCGIKVWAYNRNPEQSSWTDSPKAYCQLYIDDAALGCPLVRGLRRPYVDWSEVDRILRGMYAYD